MYRSFVAAFGVVVLVGSACSAGGASSGAIPVTGSEYKFDPSTVTAKAGQRVTVSFKNSGTLAHNFTVQNITSTDAGLAQPGQTVTVQFTPSQAGTYRIVCTQPGHEQLGMVGQLVVQ